MEWFAQAPSNIALIKYMGKTENNLPDNASLSYTLNNLQSSVMLEKHSGTKDFWGPLHIPGAMDFKLPIAAQERFLKHLDFLKQHFDYKGSFIVHSSNNFPHSSGLASSASSFAALTKCAVQALVELTGCNDIPIEEQAQLSRLGSGSSCRSFFSPWALWDKEHVKAVELPYKQLVHQVIVVSHEEKSVSSSEAHARVKTSTLYKTRPKRATQRLKLLMDALKEESWSEIYHIVWQEFTDMHQLFTTSAKPFNYITEDTSNALNTLQKFWEKRGDGPLVTMDAGPNIHLLYRPDQKELAMQFKHDHLLGNYDVL